MNPRLHLIYFSPTGTTQKIVEAIAAGFGAEHIVRHDMTRSTSSSAQSIQDGIAIIGIPVYAGRVPEICLERIAHFSATAVPAVLVALYGNREYEDALVELRDVAVDAGYSVIAAGAFIGEHSYSTAEQPIAANRPDQADIENARQFGRNVALKLTSDELLTAPEIPGDIPYKERVPLGGISPETDAAVCTLCGTCASGCPTFVIRVGSEVVTQAENCVMCCACVKNCPPQARQMLHPVVQGRREMLYRKCSQRKEPALFI